MFGLATTPPDWLEQPSSGSLPEQPPPQVPQVPQQQGGMFGNGKFGVGEAIVAALNGYLAGRGNPVGIQNMQMMAAMRQRALEHQQAIDDYNRQRADQNTDFQAHRQYEIENPLPKEPGEFEQALIASGVQPGTPEWTQAMKTRTQNMLDPVVMTPQGPMTRSQLLGGGGQPAPAGVTFTPIPDSGGPTPGASGGFPY
jgi:hypothetical protein